MMRVTSKLINLYEWQKAGFSSFYVETKINTVFQGLMHGKSLLEEVDYINKLVNYWIRYLIRGNEDIMSKLTN